MDQFTIEIAGMRLGITSHFETTRVYFRKYLTDAPAQAGIRVTEADMAGEQQLLDEEALQEGLKKRVFTGPFLERAVIQRKAAAYGADRGILLLHGSTISVDGQGYLFTAKTGVGKSTHTRLWRELLGPRAVMVNDDRAFLDLNGSGVTAFGSPWSGKHGLDNNIRVPLRGICLLERGKENRIRPAAAEAVLPALDSQIFVPETSYLPCLKEMRDMLMQKVRIWQLTCTPDLQAAQTAYDAIYEQFPRFP